MEKSNTRAEPIWINLCDREPKREDEILELVRKRITQFFAGNRK